jgi:hypothetical protein
MIANVPGAEIASLDMGHARPVVEPEQLAELLLAYS